MKLRDFFGQYQPATNECECENLIIQDLVPSCTLGAFYTWCTTICCQRGLQLLDSSDFPAVSPSARKRFLITSLRVDFDETADNLLPAFKENP